MFFISFGVLFWGSTSLGKAANDPSTIRQWERRLSKLLKFKGSEAEMVIKEAATAIVENIPPNWAASDFSVACWLYSKEQLILRHLDELERYPAPNHQLDSGFAYVHGINMLKVSRVVAEKVAARSSPPPAQLHSPLKLLRPRPLITRPQHNASSMAPSLINPFMMSYNLSMIDLVADDADSPAQTGKEAANPVERAASADTIVPLLAPAAHARHGLVSEDSQETIAAPSLFPTPPTAGQEELVKKKDILDILHFALYAKLAYISSEKEAKHSKRIKLLHFSPDNDIFESPYLIFMDHVWKTVVIAIRGTKSAADVLVDLKISGARLDSSLGAEYRVHSGFLETAKNIFASIRESQILDRIIENPDYAEYRIVLSGHSLGAAVASLVTWMMRKTLGNQPGGPTAYDTAMCYGYSIPCLASDATAELFEEFCISIVCGHDLIPRISHLSWYRFNCELERIMAGCEVPKYKVAASMALSVIQKKPYTRVRASAKPAGEYLETVKEQGVQPSKELPPSLAHCCCAIPGRILHLEKLRDFAGRFGKPATSNSPLLTQSKQPRAKKDTKLKKWLLKLARSVLSGSLSNKKLKFYYCPRWVKDRSELKLIVFSRSTVPDHSNLFDILKTFSKEQDDEKVLRCAISI
ncbi:hypothetical protein HDU91_005510 [Kappamyces sp. JEL0680]|nr:hypothetical protein HDU91_005510 [Kappamyces sp. JEL0680]